MLVLLLDRDRFTGHPRQAVNILVVDEAAEGGVARALMRCAESWGREQGCREVSSPRAWPRDLLRRGRNRAAGSPDIARPDDAR